MTSGVEVTKAAGALALVASGLLVVVAVVGAVTVTPVGQGIRNEVAVPALASPAPPGPSMAVTAPSEAELAAATDPLTEAVLNDPFSPERTPPRRRYQLPSERSPVMAEAPPEERPQAPAFRVVGSVGLAGGGAALVQVERESPRLMVIGESMMGYRLASVDAESATLEGPAGTLRLQVMEPLGGGEEEATRGRGRGTDAERAQELIQQRIELLRRQQQGVRGQGRGGRGGRGVGVGAVSQLLFGTDAVFRPGRGGGPPGPSPDHPEAS